MLKMVEDYIKEYGDVPKDAIGRLDYVLNSIKSKKSLKGKIHSTIDYIRSIEWKELEYVIYVVPKATPRPRSSKFGHFYVSGASDNKKLFKKFYKQNSDMGKIFTPCEFYCTSYLPIPKTMSSLEKILAELGFIRPISKPDFDNLAKTYSDMCQGTLLHDDALIVKGVSEKFYSAKPRVEIKVRYMEKMDCAFNYKKIFNKKEGNK